MNFLPFRNQDKPESEEELTVEEARTAMEGMIANASKVLDQASTPGLRGIPRRLFQKCHGLVLLSSVSNSFFIGGSVGTGIILPKKANGSWGLPCACGVSGTGWGLSVGLTYQDIIIFLMDKASVQGAGSRLGISLGGHIGVTLGYGRSAGFSLGRKGGSVSIAFTKGAAIGASLDGGVVGVRAGVNAKFYGHEGIRAADILMGDDVRLPAGKEHVMDQVYSKLQELSRQANKKEGIFTSDAEIHAQFKDALEGEEEHEAIDEVIEDLGKTSIDSRHHERAPESSQ